MNAPSSHARREAIPAVPACSTGSVPGAGRAVIAAVMIAALSYSLVLPVLPQLAATAALPIDTTTGWLMGSYTVAALLASPWWGLAVDRRGARLCLMVALVGQTAALGLLLFTPSWTTLLVHRVLQGSLGAGVVPAALVWMTQDPESDDAAALGVARITRASLLGGLAGPFLGGVLSRGNDLSGVIAATAVLAALALIPLVRSRPATRRAATNEPRSSASQPWRIVVLLALSAAAAAIMGASEVGVAVRGRAVVGLTSAELGLMFSGCGVVMIAVQTVLFRPGRALRVSPRSVGPALWLGAVALVWLGAAHSMWALSLIVAMIAVVAGVAQPLLTYWLARLVPQAAGVGFGARAAIAGIGQAFGAFAAGYLFLSPHGPGVGLVGLAGVLAVVGGLALALVPGTDAMVSIPAPRNTDLREHHPRTPGGFPS